MDDTPPAAPQRPGRGWAIIPPARRGAVISRGKTVLKAIMWLALAAIVTVGTWVGRSRPEPPVSGAQPIVVPGKVRPPRPVVPALRVDGDVIGVAPGLEGTLAVHVDGQVVQQVAATAGSFVVEVPASTSGMVTLEYIQPGVHFVSPLGSYAAMARMAGADGRLTRDECECTQVSAFSTALQHVATMMLGHPPRNDVQFRNVARQVGSEVVQAATALVHLADDPAQLPASHATGLALLRDRPALLAYLSTGQLLFGEPADALDSIPTRALAAPDLADRFALLGPQFDAARPTPATALVVEREGSAYRMHGAPASFSISHVGNVVENALVMLPDGEISRVTIGDGCPTTGQVTERHWNVVEDVLQQQWVSEGLEIWRWIRTSDTSFPHCPERPGYTDRSVVFQVAYDLADTRPLTNARRFIGSNALPVFCDTAGERNGVALGQCGYAVHRFSRDGSGEIVELGNKVDAEFQPIQADGRKAFSWSMGADGAMHVQAGEERIRYWVLDGGDRTALGVIHVADALRDTHHASQAGYSPMIRVGVTDTYNADTVAGAWGYATYDRQTLPSLLWEQDEVRIIRDASGRSAIWQEGNVMWNERWTTAWGRLYSTLYIRSDCGAPSTTCRVQSVRYFRPLARVGDRIHGIEEMYYPGGTDSSGNPRPPSSISRPQFHERREMPDVVPDGSVPAAESAHRAVPAMAAQAATRSAAEGRAVRLR